MSLDLEEDSEDEFVFPDSLHAAVVEQDGWEEDEIRKLLLCRYREGGDEPWLFPAAGQELGDSQQPVLVSPRPNSSGMIVVMYAGGDTSYYSVDELPEEVALVFE